MKPAPDSAGRWCRAGLGARIILRLLAKAEFSVEFIDASAGVYQLLLACIKGVTLRAYLDPDILFCASRLNNLAASALNSRLLIVWMYTLFHYVHPS